MSQSSDKILFVVKSLQPSAQKGVHGLGLMVNCCSLCWCQCHVLSGNLCLNHNKIKIVIYIDTRLEARFFYLLC